jgi:ABC-type multidrug transport system fused ATPase/permease subunit
MRSYKLDRLINNSKIWIIIVLPLTIMIVMFGYLVFQINSISEQLLVNNNISSITSSQSQGSGIDSSGSGQNMSAITSPFKIITDALVPEPSSILSVVIRTAIVATLVFIIVKWLGGKGIGQLSPFGLLIVVGLGSAIGDPMIYKEISIPQAMAAVMIAVIIFKVIDYLTLKSRRFREYIEPKPILLVEHGSIVNEGLKKAKMDMADFETELRLRGLEDASEIKYARLESKGKISYIMKEKMTSD